MPEEKQSQHPGHISPFDAIRRTDEEGREYWSARELYKLLGYSTWQRFQHTIEQAKKACQESGEAVADHFNLDVKIVKAGATTKPREDYQLSRYACYLVVLAGDESKPVVALGKVYFAVKTRQRELDEELANLPEDQKRLIYRSQMAIFNTKLAEAAQQAGVIEPFDFAVFQDHGYRGLYAGETAQRIAERKGLQPSQHILDYMGSEELGANIFRATQTDAKLRREGITGKEEANRAHHQIAVLYGKLSKRQAAPFPKTSLHPPRVSRS